MSKVTAEVRALLKAAGVTQYQLMKAGIGSASAQRLVGRATNKPVGLDTLEKACEVLGRELTTRRRA